MTDTFAMQGGLKLWTPSDGSGLPAEQVARLLPGAQFHLLAGANHYLWMSHAAVMQRVLQDFVRRVAAE